jgi:hypothetical protein
MAVAFRNPSMLMRDVWLSKPLQPCSSKTTAADLILRRAGVSEDLIRRFLRIATRQPVGSDQREMLGQHC